ncbi:MAG: RrF2 family transcriptional regulator [Anaerolineae bacterium]|nr:RrF2 family transcriptional regulator [Anaerolineae bacterium]
MRLSTKARYALRAMVDLAMQGGSRPTPREEIAVRQGISPLYLAQLFSKLTRAGLVESVKGPGGGYVLAREADTIRAGDVIRAVEEPLAPVFCVNAAPEEGCARSPFCATHRLWKQLSQRIEEVLNDVTLADLCMQACALAEGIHDSTEQEASPS